jgi:3-oxoacyl-[acyl-carrier protein] reductase
MSSFKGKTAVVTGAGHGIGREIALTLARNGADVVVTDVSDAIYEVGKEIEALHSKSLPIKCDVSNFDEAKGVENQVLEQFEKVDVLVNNAGIYPQKSFVEMTNEDWNKVLHVNLDGVFHCTKAIVPKMIERKYGKIISIASIAGAFVGFTNLVHYSASKAAIVGFTKSLALELSPYGINVNAIAPGVIDVGASSQMSKEALQQMVRIIPLGRMGLPLDIANVVLFLSSEASNYITGQCIVCDGGYTLP